MRLTPPLVLAAVVAILSAARPASAQFGGVIQGHVVDPHSGEGVGMARVLVDDAPATHADESGHFTVTGLAHGDHRVRVERVGYLGTELWAVVGDTLNVILEMEPRPDTLAPVLVVNSPRVPLDAPSILAPFYWRLRDGVGGGKLISPEELDSMAGNPTLIDVLRRLPGVRIIHSGAAMEDFLATGELPGPHALDHSPEPCYAQIFMNGVQMYVRGHGDPPNLNSFDLGEIAAIEYYSTSTFTPVQFRTLTSDCGTLVLWTRFGSPAK